MNQLPFTPILIPSHLFFQFFPHFSVHAHAIPFCHRQHQAPVLPLRKYPQVEYQPRTFPLAKL